MRRLLLLAAAAAAVAACGGPATATVHRPAPAKPQWARIVPGGGCRCSDGSQFRFWLREADPKKVVLYLEDGGACFSAETCAPGSGVYQRRVDEGPDGESGIFDYSDPRNPLAGYSAVYVPYCTADVHLGAVTKTYAPGITVHHDGMVNGTAALDRLVATFPGATDVVVIGESAGSIAAPLYAGLVADRLPHARVTALADGSGSYPDTPRLDRIIAAWGSRLPAWSRKPWGFPGLFIQAGRHDPDIVLARHDYAYDAHQASWYPRLGLAAGDLLARIDGNERRIEAAGVKLLSYIAPGDRHTALTEDQFYTEEVGGEKLSDWVARLVEHKPVRDVHCRRCR